jgi:hypothetical protein
MGLREFFRGTKDEQRSLPRPDNELPLIGAYTASTVTPTAALAIADVCAAVRVLADAASSLPLQVYRKTGDGREGVTGGKRTLDTCAAARRRRRAKTEITVRFESPTAAARTSSPIPTTHRGSGGR